MKIAVISDIHDNTTNLKKCLRFLNREAVDGLICCGDLTNYDTLEILSNDFKNPIHLIKGNIEIYEDSDAKKFKNIKFYGRIGTIVLRGYKIGICHEPFFIDKIIHNELDREKKLDIIFYGHTHKPWIEDSKGIKLVNPGTLGGVFQRATFTLWETEKMNLELIVLDQLPDD